MRNLENHPRPEDEFDLRREEIELPRWEVWV